MNIIDVLHELAYLKLIVYFDQLKSNELETLKKYNIDSIKIISFNDLLVGILLIYLTN
jgi:hypothetical protein